MELIRTTGGGDTIPVAQATGRSDAYWGVLVPFALLIILKCGKKGVDR